MSAVAFGQRADAGGLEFELPDGWTCVDLRAPHLADRIDQLLRVVLDGIASRTPADEQSIRDLVATLVAGGAHCLLLRPATDAADCAISGGVFVSAPISVPAQELHRILDERGEAVALGDLDGLPIISLVGPAWSAEGVPLAAGVQVAYVICADDASVMLSFTAAGGFDRKRLIGEVAAVLSRARVVR